MHRYRYLLKTGLILFSGLFFLTAVARADEKSEQLNISDPLEVSAMVWRIIGYTRWPVDSPSLYLCVAGHSVNAEALQQSVKFVSYRRETFVREWHPDEDPATTCNVLYVGEMSATERMQLLKRLADAPVLTIGETPDFCSSGGMFCFAFREEGLYFEVNLDAIGRSELRVNPQVLRLARHLNKPVHER